MRIGLFRLLKLFFASLFLQSSWSFHSMQSLGFLVIAMMGVDQKKQEFLQQHSRTFFNTHPYMAGFIIGAMLNAYEKEHSLDDLKKHIMVSQSAFASFGDTLFWQTIRPALLAIAIITGVKYGVIGVIIFLLFYNLIHIYFRFYGFTTGYKIGWDVIYILKDKKLQWMQRIFESIGAFSIGLMPIILEKEVNLIFLIPLSGIFLILLWKRLAPILILTFVFILIIINLILL
ncbi:MAG: PTS system mannose/fructose/sorbose family transporter subunit IID [candidate division WOR-3 bacterium]|nr:PTS system mannose/fructose/sorbose family transporter subunit IID [candidate division WOR-3 bacterium]